MHTDTHAPPSRFSGAAHYVRVNGYLIFMNDPRAEERAADLLPEERAAGSADPQAQAEAILADSDDREFAPEPLENRTSEETVGPTERAEGTR
jgi:hypothetical protein